MKKPARQDWDWRKQEALAVKNAERRQLKKYKESVPSGEGFYFDTLKEIAVKLAFRERALEVYRKMGAVPKRKKR